MAVSQKSSVFHGSAVIHAVMLTGTFIVILLMINVLLLLIGMLVDDVSGGIFAAVVLLPVDVSLPIEPVCRVCDYASLGHCGGLVPWRTCRSP